MNALSSNHWAHKIVRDRLTIIIIINIAALLNRETVEDKGQRLFRARLFGRRDNLVSKFNRNMTIIVWRNGRPEILSLSCNSADVW